MFRKSIVYFLAGIGLLLMVNQAGGQDVYKKQAGFRFGNTTGFTYKLIKEDYFAFEGILGFRNHGAQLYVLFENRRPVFFNKLENMYLYFGGGLHAGFVKWSDYPYDDDPYYYYDDHYNHAGPAFGLDGVIGMEYSFSSVPITLAADFKPFVELYGPFLFRANFWDFGFHVRYNF
jgi:hypothetical protein